MAKAVIGGAFLRIRQHRIGFVDFLEPALGLFAPAITVGVMFHRQLAESRLQLGFITGAFNAENFIIVAHGRFLLAPAY